MVGVLIYSEKDTLANELLSGARQLGLQPLSVAVLGPDASSRAADFFRFGASAAYVLDPAAPADLDSGNIASFLDSVVRASGVSTVLLGQPAAARSWQAGWPSGSAPGASPMPPRSVWKAIA